jgi:hypothetical protein
MRTLTRAALVAATAVAAFAPASAHAQSADGCVTEFATTPYYMSNDLVTIDPDGIVTVNPSPVLGLVPQARNAAVTFVKCAV